MTITLEQARRIVEEGDGLTHELSKIEAHLKAFRALTSETVECRAYATGSDPFGRITGMYATLLPVPRSVAISALERERAKAVAKLAELGVQVPAAGEQ